MFSWHKFVFGDKVEGAGVELEGAVGRFDDSDGAFDDRQSGERGHGVEPDSAVGHKNRHGSLRTAAGEGVELLVEEVGIFIERHDDGGMFPTAKGNRKQAAATVGERDGGGEVGACDGGERRRDVGGDEHMQQSSHYRQRRAC